MKKITTLITILLIVGVSYSQENDEKRIKFNKGVIKICTSSNMNITGYDGDEVIIKSLNNNYSLLRNSFQSLGTSDRVNLNIDAKLGTRRLFDSTSQNVFGYIVNSRNQEKLEKGLKPLGNKSTDPRDNLYLDIEEKSGELIIKDYKPKGQQVSTWVYGHSNDYELLIPNTLKLLWNVENCQKTKTNTFFVSTAGTPWQLSNFKGEVEISSSYSNVSLLDVSGPVLINTLGGNIKVVFDKTSPNELYSLISNNGYIDIALPRSANINVDAIGKRILSDIDFKVLEETIVNGTKGMELQLNSGKTKMKLDAGSGSIYLRKK